MLKQKMYLSRIYNSDYNFFYWRRQKVKKLINNSSVIRTKKGIVEYFFSNNKQDGPVIVGIHGAPGDCSQNKYLFHGMQETSYRFLSWSRPGYSRTSLEMGKSYTEQADVLVELLDTLKIDKVGLISFSCGGPIAIEFAIRYPDRVNAMIFESAVAHRFKVLPASLIKLIIDKISYNDSGSWINEMLEKKAPISLIKMMLYRLGNYSGRERAILAKKIYSSKEKRLLLFDYILEPLRPFSLIKKGYLNDLKLCLNMKQFNFEKIKIPTLIIHGTSDGDVPFEHAEFLKSKIQGSELYPVKGAPHPASLVNMSEIINKKIKFLTNNCK